MRSLWQGLGFRRQLVVTITGTFLLGGTILLVGQYVVLRRILNGWLAVYSTTTSPGSGAAPSPTSSAEALTQVAESAPPVSTAGASPGPLDDVDSDSVVMFSAGPSITPVLREVQVWSAVFLLLFAVFSLVGAMLVTRGVAHRIGRIAADTASITRDDLSRRLDTSGPDDEIRDLSTSINTMIEGLDGAFRRQEAFIANAAHEFRTPLATTRTVLQVADRQGRVPPDLAAEVNDVLAANARMNDLVAALLVLARARTDSDLPVSEVDLAGLVRDIVALHEAEAGDSQVALDAELDAENVLVTGNEPLLRSLVDNLVTNAVRHNRPGGFARVTLSRQAGTVLLSVTSSGRVRLSRDAVARLTEPFHRGERSRLHNDDGSRAGVGLGLSLVDTVVSAHGGSLELAPREPDGLAVHVTLPAS